MSKYYAYIRVSTDKQTLENQKHKILEFAFNKKIQIEDFIEVEVSSCKKRMNLATNNGNTWSDKTVLFGH